jgi:hypothetical protein
VVKRPHPEEPAAGPWRVERIAEIVAAFAHATPPADGRPLVVAIDGRSSSGKTTLAGRIAAAVPSSAVVHTDDIAWAHSRFGWADLARRLLQEVRLDAPLLFRPAGWDNDGREGAIVVPRGVRLLLIEGVGSSRDELADL